MSKELLILEKSSVTLKPTQDGNTYVLEGTFGEIGKKNKNNRIYDEEQYVPQIISLQEKIEKSKLLGELDHPKQFDISLSNVSHVIENLKYDKETKTVRGKIRLLGTPKGKIAKALVEDGIPLHISSRAAGSVNENGHVIIKKLFTYDLVADPGFENAELNRVNEDYGFENDENLFIYEINELNDKNAQKVDDKYKNNKFIMEDFVKINDFDKYTDYTKNKIIELEKTVSELKENSNTNDGESEELIKVREYTKKVADTVNSLGKYIHYLAENVDTGISSKQELDESIDKVKVYMGYVTENLDKNISHHDHIVEGVDDLKILVDAVVERSDSLEETVTGNEKYMKYIAEMLDGGYAYMEHVAEKSDTGLQYSEHLAENIEKSIVHGNFVAENMNSIIGYNDYIKENIEQILENNKSLKEELITMINEAKVAVPAPHVKPNDYKTELTKKLDQLIESAKKQKAEHTDNKNDFLKFLDENKKKEFLVLPEDSKKAVVEAMVVGFKTPEDVLKIYEGVVNKDELNFLENIPETQKEAWEKLDETLQAVIVKQAKHHKIDTMEQINEFWETRDLRAEKIKLEPLNELQTPQISNERLESIKEQLKLRFNR